MDSRVILVGSLAGLRENRSSSVVTQSVLHLLACRRATGGRASAGPLTADAIHQAANRHPAALF